MILITAMAAMFLFGGDDKAENPWKARVAEAEKSVRADGAGEPAFEKALDVAWRADDWEAGERIADRAIEKHPHSATLRGEVVRALWRAGRIVAAEELASRIKSGAEDRAALYTLAIIQTAKGKTQRGLELAEKLSKHADATAADLALFINLRSELGETRDLARQMRELAGKLKPANGYPETFMGEVLEGMPEFIDKIGDRKLNEIAAYGSAEMPVIPVIDLPGCQVMINGRGPYRMVVDTGGSTSLSLDSEVAEELGLERMSEGKVHGVGGGDAAWQTLAPAVRIGTIELRDVPTRAFGVRKSVAYACDGIIGTGIFSNARMTLDFQHARLVVSESSEKSAAGTDLPVRIVGDAKIFAPITVQGGHATALIDSGAGLVALSPKRLRMWFPGKRIETIAAPMAGVGSSAAPTLAMSPGVEIKFGGRTFSNYSGMGLDALDGLLSSFLGIQADVLMGMPVLRQMATFTVDFPKRKAWADWLTE